MKTRRDFLGVAARLSGLGLVLNSNLLAGEPKEKEKPLTPKEQARKIAEYCTKHSKATQGVLYEVGFQAIPPFGQNWPGALTDDARNNRPIGVRIRYYDRKPIGVGLEDEIEVRYDGLTFRGGQIVDKGLTGRDITNNKHYNNLYHWLERTTQNFKETPVKTTLSELAILNSMKEAGTNIVELSKLAQ